MTLQLDTRYLPELSPEKHGILDHQSGDLFLSPETEKDWSAGEIQRYSGQFFNSYHDLLRGASGVVIQASWDDDMGIVGWDQKGKTFNVDTKTADTITLGFSAEKHVKDEELRCDDKGNKYYGTGIFGWQLTRTSGHGRTLIYFETHGAELGNVHSYSFDGQGKRTVQEASPDDIAEAWLTIHRLTTDPIFQEHVEHLREHRAKAVRSLGELSIAKHTMPHRTFRIEEERMQKILDKQGFGRFFNR